MGFVWVHKASKKKSRLRKATTTYKKLEDLAKKMSPAVKISLSNGITAFKKRIPKDAVLNAFATGDFLAALHLIPWAKLPEDLAGVVEPLGLVVDKTAAIQIAKLPPNINKNLRFDTENPQVLSYLTRRTGNLITSIEDDARDNVRAIIASSFKQAQTPRQLAERIKGSIGILPAHEQALANYRAGLEETDKSAKEIEKLGDAYEDRLLDYRTNTIARTETWAAINNGQLAVWREGVNQGYIEKSTATKEWIVDGNPCEICEALDGTQVLLDDFFMVDGESVDGPPGHPNCFCGLELHFGETPAEETEE